MNGMLFDTTKDAIESIYTDGNLRISIYRKMDRRDRAVICKGLQNSVLNVQTCTDEGSHKDGTTSFLIRFRPYTQDLESVRGQIKRWLSGHLQITACEQISLL